MRLLLLLGPGNVPKVKGKGVGNGGRGSQDDKKNEFGSTNKNNKQLLVIYNKRNNSLNKAHIKASREA